MTAEFHRLAPDLRRITAPNPSPMTYTGTQSYLLGQGDLALIDPGPAIAAHKAAILAALAPGEQIVAVFVTHAHLDHTPLASAFDVPVHGRAWQGRQSAALGGGEGGDASFSPDVTLHDGQKIAGDSWALEVCATPGHMREHLAFVSEDRLFSGDHLMGWATTLISPPDGDLLDFMASLDRCEALAPQIAYPGHGEPITDPLARIREIRAHRQARSAQIAAALGTPKTVAGITAELYRDVPQALQGAAARNVLAHLLAFEKEGRAERDRPQPLQALWAFR